jgi:hypothetical protein
MSDNEMQSNEKADTRTVTILAEIWHALLEIAGRQIDRENAEVYWSFDYISPEILKTACGSNSVS